MSTEANDVAEITNLVTLIAHASDEGDLDVYASTFTEDAGVSYPGIPPMKGTAEILPTFRGMYDAGFAGPTSPTRHVVSTVAVVVDGDRATARSYAQVVNLSGAPTMLGRYNDEFVRTAAGWRFTSRQFETISSPPSAP